MLRQLRLGPLAFGHIEDQPEDSPVLVGSEWRAHLGVQPYDASIGRRRPELELVVAAGIEGLPPRRGDGFALV